MVERTLRKQRLRWSQGWFEVAIRHLRPLTLSRHTSLRQKLGFFLLLGFREAFVYLTFHPTVLVAAYLGRDFDNAGISYAFLASGVHCYSYFSQPRL